MEQKVAALLTVSTAKNGGDVCESSGSIHSSSDSGSSDSGNTFLQHYHFANKFIF